MKNFKLVALAIIFAMTGINFIEAKGICKKGQEWNYKKAKCVDSQKKSNSSKKLNLNFATKAEQLVDAINNQDTQTVMTLFSSGNQKSNLLLINGALTLTPDNSAVVRCMASNPDCGVSPTRRILEDLKNYIEGMGVLNQSFIQGLFHQHMNSNEMLMGSNPATYAPRTFDPAKQFNGDGLIGNYFSATQVATIHDPSGKNSQQYTFTDVVEKSGYGIDETAPDGLVFFGSFMTAPQCAPGMMCAQVMTNTALYGKLQSSDDDSSAVVPVQTKYRTLPINVEKRHKIQPIADDQFFHVGDPNYQQPPKGPVMGFRAPDYDTRSGKRATALTQIHNSSDQDQSVSFLNSQKEVIDRPTVPAQSSMVIPQDIPYIQAYDNAELIEVIPNKSYLLVFDNQGNVSIKVNQIYY
ncbi:hypothetical protein KBC04_05155 [Candidatus Babeliales bacterium]|nr:hypothetical protein [Candidatus Babeliales bacterium]MBP9844133.1 hypothetical protein [Candidatus Babeliales bacterium]